MVLLLYLDFCKVLDFSYINLSCCITIACNIKIATSIHAIPQGQDRIAWLVLSWERQRCPESNFSFFFFAEADITDTSLLLHHPFLDDICFRRQPDNKNERICVQDREHQNGIYKLYNSCCLTHPLFFLFNVWDEKWKSTNPFLNLSTL